MVGTLFYHALSLLYDIVYNIYYMVYHCLQLFIERVTCFRNVKILLNEGLHQAKAKFGISRLYSLIMKSHQHSFMEKVMMSILYTISFLWFTTEKDSW